MRKAIERLGPFDEEKGCTNVIVETPKGSRVKYAYLPEAGMFQIKRALPEGMVFPFNFGFIPSTQGDDGDPIDILIINEEPILPGCLLKARLLGVIRGRQTEDGESVENDRLIGMAIDQETPPEFFEMELDNRRRKQIEFFFKAYNKLNERSTRCLAWEGRTKRKSLFGRRRRNSRRKKAAITGNRATWQLINCILPIMRCDASPFCARHCGVVSFF